MFTKIIKTIKTLANLKSGLKLSKTVSFSTKDNLLTIVYQSETTKVKTNLSCTSPVDGQYSIDCVDLFHILPLLEKSKTHFLEFANQILTITLDSGQRVVLKLNDDILEGSESDIPDIDDTLGLPTKDLVRNLKVASKSTQNPKDSYQKEFTTLCVQFNDNNCTLVSTDRYRVTKISLAKAIITQKLESQFHNHLIESKDLKNIISLLSKTKQEYTKLNFNRANRLLTLDIDNLNLTFLTGSYTYPDTNRILPTQFLHSLEFNRLEFTQALEALLPFCKSNDKFNNKINLNFDQNSILTLWTESKENAVNSLTVGFVNVFGTDIKPCSQAFNCQFLIDALQSFDSESITYSSNSSDEGKRPITITSQSQKSTLVLTSGLVN